LIKRLHDRTQKLLGG